MSDLGHRWLVSGGIGSGKSAVRELLGDGGFLTIDADSIGHRVLEPDGPAYDEVAARWPGTIVEGQVDRQALGRIVFDDVVQLRELEAITHPHIFGTIKGLVNENEAPVAIELPLISHGLGEGWQRLIVDATDEIRLERLIDRGMSESNARARMAAQPSRREWLGIADLVLPNHGTIEELSETLSIATTVM